MDSEKTKRIRYEMNVDECGSSSNMRRSTESQGFLPDDLLIMILFCLPAETLYNVIKFVYRHWYNIIQSPSFISSHLQNSTMSFFITQYGSPKKYILEPTCSGVEVKELKLRCVDRVRASCNGLIFVLGPKYRKTQCPSYIVNLVTKQYLPLPLNPDNVVLGRWYLAYAATSKVYKVLYTGYKKLILTLGVDKGWRKVDINQLTSSAHSILTYYSFISSVSHRGFVYWLPTTKNSFILYFDVETETFGQQIPLPPEIHNNNNSDARFCSLCVMKNSICLCKCETDFSFEFWLLKDRESGDGQWEKLLGIDLTGQISVISNLLSSPGIGRISPHGWIQSGELLVLSAQEGIIFYNVKTGELHKHDKLDKPINDCYFHVESLVPMNNLSLVMATETPCKIKRSISKLYSKDNMKTEFEEL